MQARYDAGNRFQQRSHHLVQHCQQMHSLVLSSRHCSRCLGWTRSHLHLQHQDASDNSITAQSCSHVPVLFAIEQLNIIMLAFEVTEPVTALSIEINTAPAHARSRYQKRFRLQNPITPEHYISKVYSLVWWFKNLFTLKYQLAANRHHNHTDFCQLESSNVAHSTNLPKCCLS